MKTILRGMPVMAAIFAAVGVGLGAIIGLFELAVFHPYLAIAAMGVLIFIAGSAALGKDM
jgi:hypothetical protein